MWRLAGGAEPDHAAELDALRGRPCWLVSGPLLGILALHQAWGIIRFTIFVENLHQSARGTRALHGYRLDPREGIHNANGRAMTAVVVAGSSMVFAAVVLTAFQQMQATRAKIRVSLLVQFVLRGAFVATFVAVVAQSVLLLMVHALIERGGSLAGAALLHESATRWPMLPVMAHTLCISSIAGASEEVAKLLTLLLCMEFALPSEALSKCWPSTSSCCCHCVVESAGALSIAGVAVGLGFMILENVEYTVQEAIADGQVGHPANMWLIGAFRMLFNLHWILSGLSAARLASAILPRQVGCARRELLPWQDAAKMFVVAVWPSVCFHTAWDFIVFVPTWATLSANEQSPAFVRLVHAIVVVTLGAYFVSLLRLLWRSWPFPDECAGSDSEACLLDSNMDSDADS